MTDSDEESTGELLCSDEEFGEPECEAKRRVNRQSRLNETSIVCSDEECGELECEAKRDANVSHSIKCGQKYNFNKMIKKNN